MEIFKEVSGDNLFEAVKDTKTSTLKVVDSNRYIYTFIKLGYKTENDKTYCLLAQELNNKNEPPKRAFYLYEIVTNGNDTELHRINDTAKCNNLLNEIKVQAQTINQQAETVSNNNSSTAKTKDSNTDSVIPHLDLVDVSLPERQWKTFKKTASQEELFILALGSKYRLRTSIFKSLIFALGLIISVAVGIATIFTDYGLIILIGGYLIFSFLSTKHIRYQDTYNQLERKLKGKYKDYIKNVLNYSIGLKILDFFLQFALMWLTIPYQAVMLALGLVAPNFAISKSGILATVPKGYGLENLIETGEYYKKTSLLDDLMNTQYENSHKYEGEFTNDMGCTTHVHSSDGIHYHDDSGSSYITDDNGRTIRED